jgi:hypothetical protein
VAQFRFNVGFDVPGDVSETVQICKQNERIFLTWASRYGYWPPSLMGTTV